MSVGPNQDQSSKGLNPIVGDEKSKIEKRVNPIQYYIKFSFGITYIFLLTTASITFVEALRTNNSIARHVFNLETAISLIAGYFYSVFLDKISAYEKDDIQIDWVDVTATRYIDWSLTTPLMLLVLCLVMAQNIGKKIRIHIFAIIAFLNYLMLYFGRLGETQTITRVQACILGFAMFALMFALIFVQFVGPKYNTDKLGNVLDEHGQLQWEDTDQTEKAYKIRYLDASGAITDEANAVHIAAFVGCTYHCG